MSDPLKIAIVIDIGWPLKRHQEAFAGIQEVVEKEGWEATILPLPESVISHRKDWPFDGVVGRISAELAALMAKAKTPTVSVWLSESTAITPGVFPDWEAAGRKAAEHLISRGLRRFAYLGWRGDRGTRRQLSAFRATLQGAGYDCDSQVVSFRFDKTQHHWEGFSGRIARWIENWKPPIGLCVADDLLGRYFVDICRQHGLEVPDDVALIGSHNEPLICDLRDPSLSSIDMAYREIGKSAAKMLGKLMRGEKLKETQQIVPPQGLVTRRSTDVFAVDDKAVAQALRFISEESRRPIRVDDVATHVGLSRRTLERRFRSTLARTVATEITRLRIERTKRQLLTSDSSIKALAYQNGFRDSSHLCTVFLRETGMSPAAWRDSRNAS